MHLKYVVSSVWVILWIVIIVKATYQISICANDLLSWTLGFDKDLEDEEWKMFVNILPFLLLQNIIYFIAKRIASDSKICTGLPILSLFLRFGFPCVFILITIMCYSQLAKTKSFVILGLFATASCVTVHYNTFGDNETHFYLHIILCWTNLRGISYCVETWSGKAYNSGIWKYSLYPPTLCYGPFLSYQQFNTKIQWNTRDWHLKGIKLYITILCMEVLRYLLPVHILTVAIQTHPNLSTWCIAGCIFWNGMNYFLKYYIMYGSFILIVTLDHRKTHELPACVAYLYSYRRLFQQFDVGMYNFLRMCIYIPVCLYCKPFNSTIAKYCGKISCFIFLIIWHGMSYGMVAWILLNFVNNLAESVHDMLHRCALKQGMNENTWVQYIKPVIYVPITGAAILGNGIICSNFASMNSFCAFLWMKGNCCCIFIVVLIIIKAGIYMEKVTGN